MYFTPMVIILAMLLGAKFNCAAQFDICTVHPKWLLDSIDKNELQSEVDYFVHPDGMYIIIMRTRKTFSFIDDDYYPPGPGNFTQRNFGVMVTVHV